MTDSQMDAPELLPCPFCGEAAGTITDATRILGVWNLVHRCNVLGPIKIERGARDSVVAAWNRRATPTVLAADPAVKALIAAERERCAGECDRTAREADMFGDKHGRQISERTAAAIRGETP